MRRTDGPWPVWEIIPGGLYQRGMINRTVNGKRVGLEHYGIQHVISLAPRAIDTDLRPLVKSHIHHSIADGLTVQWGPWLLETAAQLARLVEHGEAVMTMCRAGRNRSGLMSALIAREVLFLSGEEALQLVRRERPNALANPAFERWLKELS